MTTIDRLLQRWRMNVAQRCLGQDVRLVDIGAHEGELFTALGSRLRAGFGVEPLSRAPVNGLHFSIHPGYFPAVRPSEKAWDAISMLAVLEHIPPAQQSALADACHELLRTGGRVVITVPSRAVDYILGALHWLHLIHGMSLEQHFGFEPTETLRIFSAPRFRLVRHARFQLGLNHLFVFEKTA